MISRKDEQGRTWVLVGSDTWEQKQVPLTKKQKKAKSHRDKAISVRREYEKSEAARMEAERLKHDPLVLARKAAERQEHQRKRARQRELAAVIREDARKRAAPWEGQGNRD
jgi:epoxyqueuosine reductase QueG